VNGGLGDDSLTGGDGIDIASYAGLTRGVTVSLATAGPQDTHGGDVDTLSGFENLTGGDFDDRLTGDDNTNVLTGAGGDDLLAGGLGFDTLDGGEGNDTADYHAAVTGVAVSVAIPGQQNTGGAGIDTLVSIENLIGGQSDDSLSGDNNANLLDGRARNDALAGAGGADTLLGGAGNDLLTGGAGRDVLAGGAGKDKIVYFSLSDSTVEAPDLIKGLQAIDRVTLASIDANVNVDGDQRFSLVSAFTHTAGEAVITFDSGENTTLLELDVNGDGMADGAIAMAGDQTDFTNFAL
jgi:Ca2+-binding RTX toxin-like protein